MTLPRYKALAAELQEEIHSGRFPVGEQLPPEVELCGTYGVSRHTIRDALRLLREAGLVERRRGSGTTVLLKDPRPAFVQPLGGMDEILQFAHDARLVVRRTDFRPLTSAERRRTHIDDEEDWLIAEATRVSGSIPLVLSEIYINAQFQGLRGKLNGWEGAVQELIARDYDVEVHRIEQEISADLLSAPAAKILGLEPGCGVLQTLRRYYDAVDRLILASDNVHAGSRFLYSMSYRRSN